MTPEKQGWEKNSWCVSIVAEAMTFAKTQPIGKDASHITKKLRNKISKAIAEAIKKRELEIEEAVKKLRLPFRDLDTTRGNRVVDKVISIIHNK